MKWSYSFAAAALGVGSIATLAGYQPAGAQLVTADMATPAQPPAGSPVSFVELTQRLQPAVVNISTELKVTVGVQRNPFTGEQREISKEGSADGSGFLISQDGFIVTNNHVIVGPDGKPANAIYVTLTDGQDYTAELIGRDATSDIAVLKIKGNAFPYVKLGNSDDTQVGEWVLAIGNPLGIGSSVTAGIVSAVERNAGRGAYDRLIQTDTAINPGNSGGPLFNLSGEVIGINNRQLSLTQGNIGINFAIPASEASPVIAALMDGQKPQRGYLGVGTQQMGPDAAAALGIEKNQGELVGQILEGGAADKAGLQNGDIILAVDDEPVKRTNSLAYLISRKKPGSKVKLDILRKGKPAKLVATVETRPTEEEISNNSFRAKKEESAQLKEGQTGTDDRFFYDSFGLGVQPLTPEIARELGFERSLKGAIVSGVTQYGTAGRVGLTRGDVIVSVNYQDVDGPASLAKLARQAKKEGKPAIFLGVRRPGEPLKYGELRFDD